MKCLTTTAIVLVGLLSLSTVVLATTVTDVQIREDGERLQLVISTDQPPADPTVFTTTQPARIVVELAQTGSTVPARQNPVSIGPVQSWMALASGDRTRVVVDLARLVDHDVAVQGNSIVLSMARGAVASRASVASTRTNAIQGIDFRRGPAGESRIVVALDQPGVNFSIDERAARLRVDLFETRLPEQQMQKLDVTDFATPVQAITPEVRGNNTRLNIDIAGTFTHLAYQTGNQLVVEVSRPEVEPTMARELEFFEEREYEGERFTLNFQNIPVRSLLQLIAETSGLNIVVSDSVTGNLTLRLNNVPWDQALDIVLETRNLDMRESGNVRWVAPAEEIAAREQQILRARAERQTLEPLRTVMIPVSYANASSLAELIQSARTTTSDGFGGRQAVGAGMLSERGSVTLDQRTNTLLVTDTADSIERIRNLVTELDRPVRQVLIESRIVIAR
ncbi:MAG: AMIN domain-containing protein, partial [Wenzhouxiangellaceae bacterium]